MYEAFLQSDQVKQVIRGSTQILGAITMLRKICNHPDLVCPPGDSSLETFIKKGSFSEEDLFQQEYSDDDGDVLDELEDGDDVSDRSGKLEVLAKILPLWKKQGHRYVSRLQICASYLRAQI
jgi:DNA excision repair protein ERCC-6